MARTSATPKSKQPHKSPTTVSKPRRSSRTAERSSGSRSALLPSSMSVRLDDTALVILSAAAKRADGLALPCPSSLRGSKAAIGKKLTELVSKGLLKDAPAKLEDPIWRTDEQQRHLTLMITGSGIAAIDGADPEPTIASRPDEAKGKAVKHAAKAQSKSDFILGLLRRPDGVSLGDLCAATSWQPHSVRGFLSGALRKKLGLEVESTKSEAGERRYRVPPVTK